MTKLNNFPYHRGEMIMGIDQKQFDILVVDDNRNNLRLLNDILVGRGYRVRPVPGGRMALSAARAKTPDLVLLDIMMPEMDGYTVCKILKKDIRFRDTPVIFISALSETIDKVKAFDAGCVDYITKPFQAAEVNARVQTHLSLRNAQKQLEEKNHRLQQEIEKHKKTETVLERTNDILRNILSTSPIGICLIENDRFKWANTAMLRMFDFADEREIRGRHLKFIYSTEAEYETAARTLNNGIGAGATARVDSYFRKKSGETFTGHLKMRFTDSSDPVKRAIITLSDETWRIKAETEKLYREKLQGALEMAGAVCHELNQPLQAISGYSEIIQRKHPEDPFLGDKIGKVLDQVIKMGEITRKLMKISIYETKDYVEGVRIIDINKSASENDPR